MKERKISWVIATPVILIIGFSILFYFFITPNELVRLLGFKNAYLLIFILAFIGGLTTFSGIPYYLVLIALATEGVNPFLLGLASAVGVGFGDMTSYYVGYHGGAVLPEGVQKIFYKLYFYVEKKHPKLLPWFCFGYGSLVPFSNDFIAISAGIARYSFWRIMIPLSLGNIVFNVSLAYITQYIYGIL